MDISDDEVKIIAGHTASAGAMSAFQQAVIEKKKRSCETI